MAHLVRSRRVLSSKRTLKTPRSFEAAPIERSKTLNVDVREVLSEVSGCLPWRYERDGTGPAMDESTIPVPDSSTTSLFAESDLNDEPLGHVRALLGQLCPYGMSPVMDDILISHLGVSVPETRWPVVNTCAQRLIRSLC